MQNGLAIPCLAIMASWRPHAIRDTIPNSTLKATTHTTAVTTFLRNDLQHRPQRPVVAGSASGSPRCDPPSSQLRTASCKQHEWASADESVATWMTVNDCKRTNLTAGIQSRNQLRPLCIYFPHILQLFLAELQSLFTVCPPVVWTSDHKHNNIG